MVMSNVIDIACDRSETTNMTVINATADSAWIVFQPEAGPAIYSFYYLPYRFAGGDGARYHATYESLLIPPTSPYTRVI